MGFMGLWRWDHGIGICWSLTKISAWSDGLGDFLAQDLVDQKYQSMVCSHNCVRGKFNCVSWLLLLLHSGAAPAPHPDSVLPPTARDNPYSPYLCPQKGTLEIIFASRRRQKARIRRWCSRPHFIIDSWHRLIDRLAILPVAPCFVSQPPTRAVPP